MTISPLFEYQNKSELSVGLAEGLGPFLDEIWRRRDKPGSYYEEDDQNDGLQKFMQFLHRRGDRENIEIKSNKYVGVIHYEDCTINLLPKIFYDNKIVYGDGEIKAINYHILWWLSYCRKCRFPNLKTDLNAISCNSFFEILIFMFSKYTSEVLANFVFQKYIEIDRELDFIKGRLNISEYIGHNLARGRWHKLNCTYESFEIDNRFNRIVKYVANLLHNHTQDTASKRYLGEIIFILDDVSDVTATAQECASISFNPMFGEFDVIRDFCYLFLSNSVSYSYKDKFKLFAFLLPMEYVFEDFIFGFIEREVSGIKPKSRDTTEKLAQKQGQGVFKLKPDYVLQYNGTTFLADAKYKRLDYKEQDKKQGISQDDLYQMIAYAIRFNVKQVILFYPCFVTDYKDCRWVTERSVDMPEYTVKDELAGGQKITIIPCILPIINEEQMNEYKLDDMFEEAKSRLAYEISNVVKRLFTYEVALPD